MSSGELAALITALGVSIGAIITSIAALLNARNNKEAADRLREDIKKLHDHNEVQDSILLERESTINKLRAENETQKKVIEALQGKISRWQDWGITVGRLMNELQLEVGYLTSQSKKQTAPLPQLETVTTTLEQPESE